MARDGENYQAGVSVYSEFDLYLRSIWHLLHLKADYASYLATYTTSQRPGIVTNDLTLSGLLTQDGFTPAKNST